VDGTGACFTLVGGWKRNLSEMSHRREHAHAIIVANNIPVGYLCWQTPSQAELLEAGLADLPDDLMDVDIMIGEPDVLGKRGWAYSLAVSV
jgi:hypothetical protein